VEGKIYWSLVADDRISPAGPDGTTVEDRISAGLTNATRIATDLMVIRKARRKVD
jgi:hypothetical protein